MSIRDYNKLILLKNMTTGEEISSIPFDEFADCDIYYECGVGEVKLLKFVKDCIDNNTGCLISIGYKK